MAAPGPAPNPNSRRQTGRLAGTWVELPAAGRTGSTPPWPLVTVADIDHERELEVWEAIWRTPQATAWELGGWLHDIALYVRLVVFAETGVIKAAVEARQWSDRLGLNPSALLRNRWRIVQPVGPPAPKSVSQRRRRRLTVVAHEGKES